MMRYYEAMAEAAASGDAAEARGFEALSDANRREILRILSGGDKPVQEIADAMTISRPAVSRHVRLLKDARSTRPGRGHP